MLIKPRTDSDYWLHPDLDGVFHIINDLFENQPERFGPPETRRALQAMVKRHCQTPTWPIRPDFYDAFAGFLRQHQLSPFKDLSVALVGIHPNHPHTKREHELIRPLTDGFGTLHYIDASEGSYLGLKDPLACTKGEKVDYLITGNVLNDPEFYRDAMATVEGHLACASLLKAGGRAFHFVGYGGNDPLLDDDGLQRLCGQRHRSNIPPGPFTMWGKHTTRVVGLEQVREVSPTYQDVSFFVPQTLIDRFPLRFSPLSHDTPQGPVAITIEDYQRYFAARPERRAAIGHMNFAALVNPNGAYYMGWRPNMEDGTDEFKATRSEILREVATHLGLAQDSGQKSAAHPPTASGPANVVGPERAVATAKLGAPGLTDHPSPPR